ncbi:hypothetical protein D0T85_02690 [Bacteroides sp. 519]|nr:hypothetical protein [Bacteroides sp. 519]
MISSKLLKNSARISRLLSEQKSASLDPNYHRVQGPTAKCLNTGCSGNANETAREVFLNGERHVIKTERHPSTGEYIVVVE